MKLIFCNICKDIFNLTRKKRSCLCGSSKGHYVDNFNVEYSGENAIPVKISNPELFQAVKLQPENGIGKSFGAFVVSKKCKNMKKKY